MTDDDGRHHIGEAVLEEELSELKRSVVALREDIETVSDLDHLAISCETALQQVKRLDHLIHDFLVQEHWTTDALEPDPLERAQEYLHGPLDQIRAVMSQEYELEISKKRLRVAAAFSQHLLDMLDAYLESSVEARKN